MAIGLLIRTGCSEIQGSYGETRQETIYIFISEKIQPAEEVVWWEMGGRKNRETVRICKNENVLPDVQTEEENNGGHSEDRQVINCGAKKEDDKTQTKSQGKDGALQL